MIRTGKSRKRSGSILLITKHNAGIRSQIKEEKAKHSARMIDFGDRERAANVLENRELRAARLARIAHQRTEEIRRHRAAIDKFKSRFEL